MTGTHYTKLANLAASVTLTPAIRCLAMETEVRADRHDVAGGLPGGSSRVGGLPPGPRLSPVAQTLLWTVAPMWLMRMCAARLGDTFTVTLAPGAVRLVIVSGAEGVKTLFTAPSDVVRGGGGDSPVAAVMGPNSVIVLSGPEHMRQRKLLLPPFHGERMHDYAQVIVEATRRDMEAWPIGEPTKFHPRSRAITLEVILRTVFGVEADRVDALHDALAAFLVAPSTIAMLRAARGKGPLADPEGAFRLGLKRVDALIYEEIASRREESDLAERTDVLSLLLQARTEDGEAMTDAELRDELITLLVTGHETTATSLAWVVERLVRHPDKLERLMAEIDAGESQSYLTAVINETLRVRPVVARAGRVLSNELRIGPYDLPAGTNVLASISLTNYDPRIYDDPEAFRPERFLGRAPETFSWIPFGGGIRRCIGASFALHEMKVILRTVLSELEPSAPGGRRWRGGEAVRRRGTMLAPDAGARVIWRRRPAAG
jgi:cytochrome P450